jgi:hypothetical protein
MPDKHWFLTHHVVSIATNFLVLGLWFRCCVNGDRLGRPSLG